MLQTSQPLLPAEWAPQSGVLLTWPHAGPHWGERLPATEAVFERLAAAIAVHATVLIACHDALLRDRVLSRLRELGVPPARVRAVVAPSDDCWARDHGPLTVLRNGHPELLDFTFNGWGDKYPATQDNALTCRLHAQGAFGTTPLHRIHWVLEGGALDTDGAGTLLTTASCLLTDTRNGATRADTEAVLRRHLGVDRFLWLEQGHLIGDDTDGHVDTLARFCSPDTIAYMQCTDPGDEQDTALSAMAGELRAFRQRNGQPYRLIPLPLPAPIRDADGQRLPATYANFLCLNAAVLVPTYDDPADAVALSRLAACFPGRQVIGIPSRPLLYQYGSLHCVTMQLPAGVLPVEST